MNKVLFETSYIGSVDGFLSIVIFGFSLIIAWLCMKKKRFCINNKWGYLRYWIHNIITYLWGTMIVLMIWNYIVGYIDIILAYKHGEYCEVEGVVMDFEAFRMHESFTVNGVRFEDGSELTWGYTRSFGDSVITGNGQHLRIRFIPLESRNIMVYIEEIAEE